MDGVSLCCRSVWCCVGLHTFNVALEELWQNAVGSELMKNTAQELLGHASDITRYQHTIRTDANTRVTYTNTSVTPVNLS